MKYLHIFKIKTALDNKFYKVIDLSSLKFNDYKFYNYDETVKIIKIKVDIKVDNIKSIKVNYKED